MAKGKKSATLIVLFLSLAIVLIVYGANWILQTASMQMRRDVEQNLKTAATQQVALLTVWYGAISNQIKSFVDVDMLRLFASEVDSAKVDAARLRSFGQAKREDLADRQENSLAEFSARIPGLLQLLSEFVKKNNFFSARVLNMEFESYLLVEDQEDVTEESKSFLRKAKETRKPVVMPIRKHGRELVVDIIFPIFAPQYIDQKGDRVVALFVGTCSVQKAISAVDNIDAEGFFTSAVLEYQHGKLELIDPLFPEVSRELGQGWETQGEGLELAVRQEPSRLEKPIAAYTLALPVNDLPWFVLEGVRTTVAEASFLRFRKNIYIGAGLLIALTVILIAALWWWIVGRRERALADQMRKLYIIANEQKQILDGVNTALSAGIILNDLSGKIYYVNQKYADMARMAPERMTGMQYTQLPYELARSLVTHTIAIHEKPELTNFTEILSIADSARHYLTACSPCVDEKNCLMGMVSVYSDITELIEAQNKAQRMVRQTVAVLVRAIEAIDPYLCGQSDSTGTLAISLVRFLKQDDAEAVATLRIAASLSQIGMIQLPRSLLLKTGTLSPEERLEMQKHVEYARQALKGVDFGLPVLEAITQMYERIDGSGYPKHLKGDEICFNARVLAVANTFCALMRPRSYRTAHNTESALEIFEMKPYKYDPKVTQALRDYLLTEDGKVFLQKLMESGQDTPVPESEKKTEAAASA